MPAITIPNGAVVIGPGTLYKAPLLTAIPTNTVAGSVFTDAWPAAWIPVGVTREGSQWTYQPSTDNVEVAEYLDPLRIVTTGRQIGVSFDVAQVTLQNYRLGLNGGTVSTVSGTAATTLSRYSPPVNGAEIRTMIGWESDDATERLIFHQCFQTGQVSVAHRKGAANASIPVDFGVEQPSTGFPFDIYLAGTARVGV